MLVTQARIPSYARDLPNSARRIPVEPRVEWSLGVDLGMLQDPSSLAAVEWRRDGSGEWTIGPDKIEREKPRERMALRFLRTIPLLTAYAEVVDHVCGLLTREPLLGRTWTVIDRTGVGEAVAQRFRERRVPRLVTVFFTGGDITHAEGSDYRVPKATLVNNLIAKLDGGELVIAADLPERRELEAELAVFRRRISASGHVSFAAEDGKHDDRVVAVALAAWWASRKRRQAGVIHLSGF
jgi:hypothetical protein